MTHKAKNIQQRRTCITAILIGALGATGPQAKLHAHNYYNGGSASVIAGIGWVTPNHLKPPTKPSVHKKEPLQILHDK